MKKSLTTSVKIARLVRRIGHKLPRIATNEKQVKKNVTFKQLLKSAREARTTFSDEDFMQFRKFSY